MLVFVIFIHTVILIATEQKAAWSRNLLYVQIEEILMTLDFGCLLVNLYYMFSIEEILTAQDFWLLISKSLLYIQHI